MALQEAAGHGLASARSGFLWAGCLLGLALGGFADGILFHQILQWHHLLSNVPGDQFRDLRVQILADGVFHVATYVVMAIGLWLLWRRRGALLTDGSDRIFGAALLVGFGFWHVLDGVVSHWLLQIHHVRMESDNILLWDAIFLAFGVVVTALGAWLARRPAKADRASRWLTPGALPSIAVGLVIGSGAAAAMPPQAATTVLFRPGTDAGTALTAIAETGSRLVWSDPAEPTLWVVDVDAAQTPRFYAYGAVMISRSVFPAGCFGALTGR